MTIEQAKRAASAIAAGRMEAELNVSPVHLLRMPEVEVIPDGFRVSYYLASTGECKTYFVGNGEITGIQYRFELKIPNTPSDQLAMERLAAVFGGEVKLQRSHGLVRHLMAVIPRDDSHVIHALQGGAEALCLLADVQAGR